MDPATGSATLQAPTTTSNGASEANGQPQTMHAAPRPFITTKEHRRFTEFADHVRRDRYIGLCYGPPGVGKTLSARHYADWDIVDRYLGYHAYLNQSKPGAVPIPPELTRSRTIVYTPTMHNTPRTVDTKCATTTIGSTGRSSPSSTPIPAPASNSTSVLRSTPNCSSSTRPTA